MKTLPEITSQLGELDTVIGLANRESIRLREEYKLKEALYKNSLAKFTMELKAKNPTWRNPDIKAMAMNLTYEDQLEMIKAESKWLSQRNLAEHLSAQKETLIEESYNTRAELKKFIT
jgi:hypothetical protein